VAAKAGSVMVSKARVRAKILIVMAPPCFLYLVFLPLLRAGVKAASKTLLENRPLRTIYGHMQDTPRPPKSYSIDHEIDWNAQWVEVSLRVELPFWLMTDNVVVPVEEAGHVFPVSINGETFELHAGEISDAKSSSIRAYPVFTHDHKI
jgi:hypothetical protein